MPLKMNPSGGLRGPSVPLLSYPIAHCIHRFILTVTSLTSLTSQSIKEVDMIGDHLTQWIPVNITPWPVSSILRATNASFFVQVFRGERAPTAIVTDQLAGADSLKVSQNMKNHFRTE